ncbi:MAG: cupin domain-containing protein [Thermodesulfobacteriota bacterium]
MKVSHYRDIPATEPMPGVKKRVVIGPDDGAPNFIMRVFEVAPGQTSPDHAHPWEHEIFVLDGEGAARDGKGRERPFGTGSILFLPAGEKHCMINKGKDTLRFICVIPTGVE